MLSFVERESGLKQPESAGVAEDFLCSISGLKLLELAKVAKVGFSS